MKILFILPLLQIFGSNIVFELTNYLGGLEHEVLITSLDKPVNVDWFPLQNIPIPYEDAVKEFPTADVVIATNCVTAHLVNDLDTKAKKFYLVTEQESQSYTKEMWKMQYPDLPQNRLDIEYKLQVNYLEGALDLPLRHLAVSKGLVEFLNDAHRKKAEYIPIGVNPRLFYPDPIIPKDTFPDILVYGNDLPWRGLADVNLALDGIRGIRVWTVSDGTQVMKSHKHWKNPDTHTIRKTMSSCDIFINVPWHSGHASLETQAAACGAAVLTTDTRGTRDLFEHKKNAYIVSPKEPEQIRKALGYLLKNNGEMREAIVREGLKLTKTLDWGDSTKELIKVLEGK